MTTSYRKTTEALILTLLALLLLTSGGVGAMPAGELGGAHVPESRDPASLAPIYRSTGSQSTTITYTYDAAGRLIGADYGGDVRITYTYDASGNLLRRRALEAGSSYLPLLLRR